MKVLRIDSEDCGNLGIIPAIVLDSPQPKLRNNGYNSFMGQPNLTIPDLDRSRHVVLRYSCGGRFQAWASAMGNGVFSFS
jgi:hypothetical protein